MKNILLVEDDKSLNRGIAFKLKREGFNVYTTENLIAARQVLANHNIDLIILDVNLPDGSGFDFCQEVRLKSEVLIIFLTAQDDEIDVVTGLDLGGDDYLAKPFSLTILISRINALLRRHTVTNANLYNCCALTFYSDNMRLVKNGTDITLSKTEIKLLTYFLNNPQQIITREQLLNELWDIDGQFIDPNTVAVNIRRLREKIEDDPSQPHYLKTVRGIGYVWQERWTSQCV